MDLLTYLKNYELFELVHFAGNTYTTKTHDNLKISNGKWMCWSCGLGGRSALDYLIKIREYTFLEAVQTIAGQAAISPPVFLPAQRQRNRNCFYQNQTDTRHRLFLICNGVGLTRILSDSVYKLESYMKVRTITMWSLWAWIRKENLIMPLFAELGQTLSETQTEVTKTIPFPPRQRETAQKYTCLNLLLTCYPLQPNGSTKKRREQGLDDTGFCDMQMIVDWKLEAMCKMLMEEI